MLSFCGVETKGSKQAVRRNIHRFQADFTFELIEGQNPVLRFSDRNGWIFPGWSFMDENEPTLEKGENHEVGGFQREQPEG